MELIGSGRAAEVYRHGPHTVLRRYLDGRDCTLERRMMAWLSEQGAPVPAVEDAADLATDTIVMELVQGPTMLEKVAAAPHTALSHARTLARLQMGINALVAPDWFPRRGERPGTAVLHLDLHPMNVICSERGPVVIDWTNAGSGDAALDTATTFVVISTFEVDGLLERIGQRAFSIGFARSRGRSVVDRGMDDAIARRLRDPNVTAGERSRLARLAQRRRDPGDPPES